MLIHLYFYSKHFLLLFRSPDSSSCSSRDPSPCARGGPPPISDNYRPAIRRQSTTEEILIARGFRRQSTTEEMIRCRNFRRQSSQSAEECQRYVKHCFGHNLQYFIWFSCTRKLLCSCHFEE